MKSLEQIMQEYCGLDGNMFLQRPKAYGTCCGETEYQYMTDNAEKSYSKLIALLNDVNELVGIDNFNELVDELDELTRGENIMKFKSNQAGVCPFCGNEDLEYNAIQLEGEMCYFPWRCSECGAEGEEWYVLAFNGHNVIDENNDCIEITDDMIEEE